MTPSRCLQTAICVLLSTLAAACSPLTVSFTLGASPEKLEEAVVHADPRGRDKVAIIDVRGIIADSPRSGLLSSSASPVDGLVARLDKAAQDPRVKAVVLRINSPGGTVAGSDVMYRELRRFRNETGKPVVASMGEVAASGGYYIALASDTILAQPSTITGSIGVVFPTINLSDGMSRIGIRSRSIVSGPNKDIANPLEPPVEDHYAILQGIVDDFYHDFRSLVIERRPKLSTGDVGIATDGRVVTGTRAVELGLVDREGGLRDAFDSAKALADIDQARLVKYAASRGAARTPYARDPAPPPRADETDLNLVNIELAHAASLGLLPPGAYYLWIPGAP